ncbi:STREFT protein [Mycoplasma sp. HU2014]|uniref:STREFT protein n=1 Tax=Mycoplasma sp. HU2014 TaxID=1664275 RepID=UPI00067DDEBC|nr:STREFT protein [Mycoplasma sp. HU2014]KNG79521.1 membrane protein [Mycoplasma sp. HU2014]
MAKLWKSLKDYKKWYVPILMFLVVISAFLGFTSSYVDNKKHKFINNIQNYIKLSSYAVKGKILNDEEGINSSYVDQRLANKKVIDELGSNFIWKPDNDSSVSDAKIGDVLESYFGKSSNLFNKPIQYIDKNDNNKVKDITNKSNKSVTPDSIEPLINQLSIVQNTLASISSQTLGLGIDLIQKNLLKTDAVISSIRNNDIVKKVVDFILNNEKTLKSIGEFLINNHKLNPSFYKNLNVRQLFNKELNSLSTAITGQKHLNHNTDNLANDLSSFILKTVYEVIKTEFSKKDVGFIDKIKNIFNSFKNVFNREMLIKILPELLRYIKSELYFSMYYVVNENLSISELLEKRVESFKILADDKLDLLVLIKGLAKVMQEEKYANRFLDFMFKRVDKSKVYFDSKNKPNNLGTSNLFFDLINSAQGLLHNLSGILEYFVPVIEKFVQQRQDEVKEIISDQINKLFEKVSAGHKKAYFDGNKLNIEIWSGSGIFGINYVTGHVHIFGDKGIINTVINALKNLFSASSNISATLLNFIKHIFYRDKESSFSFKDAFINISNISKLFSEILDIRYIDNNKSKSGLVLYLGLAPLQAIQAWSIYDVINLPNRDIVSSLASVVKDINKVLDPLRTILNKLAEYKFTNSPSEFVDSQSSGIDKTKWFPAYLEKATNYFKKQSDIKAPKYDLIKTLYDANGNFASEFTKKWADFIVPDINDNTNPLVPIVKAITNNKPVKQKGKDQPAVINFLADVKNAIEISGESLISNTAFYRNIPSLKNINVPLSKLKALGIDGINDETLDVFLDRIGLSVQQYLDKHPKESVGIDVSAIGHILKSLYIKVTATSSVRNAEKVENKNIIKTIIDSLDSHDSNNRSTKSVYSYFLWDKIKFTLDDKELTDEITIDKSVSPLRYLIGIGQSGFINQSISYSLCILLGGLNISDEFYNISVNNKKSVTSLFEALSFVLNNKQKELNQKEWEIAGQYYQKEAWTTQHISSSKNKIKYKLIRTKFSKSNFNNIIGQEFEVTLEKEQNSNSYWQITRVIALNYQNLII